MINVRVQLTDRQIEALKARTGKRSAASALKAWAARANTRRSIAELRAALKESLKENATGKGRRFSSGREATLARELILLPRFKRDYRRACKHLDFDVPAPLARGHSGWRRVTRGGPKVQKPSSRCSRLTSRWDARPAHLVRTLYG